MNYFDEGTQICYCSRCEHVFPEDCIKTETEVGEVECCKDCGGIDCFQKMGVFGKDDDCRLFPELSGCKDWEEIKNNFHLNALCDFENEIFDYNWGRGTYSTHVDDYPLIIQWYEGLVDTKELIEQYQGGNL